jgi:hypothetical protein
LIMYVTMLFVYYFLARHEERLCIEKYGESYQTYLHGTSMFIPGRLFSSVNRPSPPKTGWPRWAAILCTYAATVALCIAGAFQLRNYALNHISVAYPDKAAVISLSAMPNTQAEQIWRMAMKAPAVTAVLRPEARYIAYILPAGWYNSDIPMYIPKGIQGHHQPRPFAEEHFKVVITEAHFADNDPAQNEAILKKACTRTGLLEMDIDTRKAAVIEIRWPPTDTRWGRIPTPLF